MRLHPSVDEALHYFAGNDDVTRVGKLAIAYSILQAERRRSELLAATDPNAVLPSPATKTWLFQLLSMVVSGSELRRDEPVFQNVTLINFNYDRVIEQFLYVALTAAGARHQQAAADAVSCLRMLRPYGTIGPLPWQIDASDATELGGTRDDLGRDLSTAARNLRTFTEQFNDDILQEEIHRALTDAHLVILLGFGFHRQNMKLLALPHARKDVHMPNVFATASGIDAFNHNEIGFSIANALRTERQRVTLFEKTAGSLMADLRLAIMARVG